MQHLPRGLCAAVIGVLLLMCLPQVCAAAQWTPAPANNEGERSNTRATVSNEGALFSEMAMPPLAHSGIGSARSTSSQEPISQSPTPQSQGAGNEEKLPSPFSPFWIPAGFSLVLCVLLVWWRRGKRRSRTESFEKEGLRTPVSAGPNRNMETSESKSPQGDPPLHVLAVDQAPSAESSNQPEPFPPSPREPSLGARQYAPHGEQAVPIPRAEDGHHKLLEAIQRAADDIYVEGEVTSLECFSNTVKQKLRQNTHWDLDRLGLRVLPHSSSGLTPDHLSPKLISVTEANGKGHLIPHQREPYRAAYSIYFFGNSDHWPSFEKPAECEVRSDGKAALIKKGVL